MRKFLWAFIMLTTAFCYGQKEESERLARIEKTHFEKRFERDSTVFEIYDIVENKPIYYQTYNTTASKSTRTVFVNNLGLNGEGETLYIWDSGAVLGTHQEYNNRVIAGDNSTAFSYHATHVAGTMIGSGVNPLARGMASQANLVSYDWNSDLLEATFAATQGMLISNHSYGFAPSSVPVQYFGAYINKSRDWDNLMYNSPYYLMVVAAGNDGMTTFNTAPLDPNYPQYDKLTGHATSKNNLVVGATEDAVVSDSGQLLSAPITNFSSQGCTDDLRIKPDIVGNGRGLFSAYTGTNSSYATLSGTSMATPNVSGSLLLIQQHYKQTKGFYLRASTLKGLVLHTADDLGMEGADSNYGWGMLNTKKAVETISDDNVFSKIQELTLNNSGTYTTTVTSDGINDLKVSISWTDPAGVPTSVLNDPTPKLVNDLDLRVTKGGQTYFPWVLTGVVSNAKADNFRDPFERVDISNASGEYTITVSHKGVLLNPQNYSLIITGISQGAIACTSTIPMNVSTPSIGETTANVVWSYITGVSYKVRHRVVGGQWTEVAVSNTLLSLSGLQANTQYEVQVASVCNGVQSNYSSSHLFTTLKTCSATTPTNVSTSGVTGVSATINWSSIEFASYQIRYKPTNVSLYSTINSANTSVFITSLMPATTYQVEVRSLCLNGNVSPWSAIYLFTTLEGCSALPPTSCNFSNITTTSVTATWNSVPLATSYGIRWRPLNAPTWSVSSSLSTSRNIINLLPNTDYEVLLTSSCETGSTSQYSQSFYFKTLSDGICTPGIPTNGLANNITTNSANISWTGTTEQWLVSYSGITVTTTSNSVNLTNLQPSTTYNVEVRGKCINSGLLSSPITVTFTTNELGCVATTPTNVVAIPTNNSLYISWNEVPFATYKVRISPQKGQPNWTEYTTATNSFEIVGLSPNTKYRIQVLSVCGNVESSWSSQLMVTTLRNNQMSFIEVVHPNPVIDYLFVFGEKIEIFDLNGRKLSLSREGDRIDMQLFPAGLYLLVVDSEPFKIIKK